MLTPFKIAWENWISSLDARGCVTGRAEGPYLINRLSRAFAAGWNAREASGVKDGVQRARNTKD